MSTNVSNALNARLSKKYPYIGQWQITKTDYNKEVANINVSQKQLKTLDLTGVSFEIRFNDAIFLDQKEKQECLKGLKDYKVFTEETGIIRWSLPENASSELSNLPLFSCYVFNVMLFNLKQILK